jgi:hypothetical protein
MAPHLVAICQMHVAFSFFSLRRPLALEICLSRFRFLGVSRSGESVTQKMFPEIFGEKNPNLEPAHWPLPKAQRQRQIRKS